jgi:hypothetical protein
MLHGLIGLDGGGADSTAERSLKTVKFTSYNLVVWKKILHYFEEPGVEPTLFLESLKTLLHSVDLQKSPVVGNKLAKLSSHVKPLNAQLNPICHFLALLGAHHILHISRVRVNTIVCVIRCITFCVTD